MLSLINDTDRSQWFFNQATFPFHIIAVIDYYLIDWLTDYFI
jgi:hypothetical protein